MYIRKIQIKNFLIHKDTTIEFSPITILVGQQGGGKSALFDALLNFSMASRGNLKQAFGPYPFSFRNTIHRSTTGVSRISYKVTMSETIDSQDYLEYEISYSQIKQNEQDQDPRFLIQSEKLTKFPKNEIIFDRDDVDKYAISSNLKLQDDRSLFASIRQAEIGGIKIKIDDLVMHCAQQITRFHRYRLDSNILSQPSRFRDLSTDTIPRLGYNGEDLAYTLYALYERNDEAIEVIHEKMKLIDTNFESIEFNVVGTERIAFSIKYSDARNLVPSAKLSSGTLTYLGLVTLIAMPSSPALLMIEEPENGLTPQAVRAFYNSIKSLVVHGDSKPNNQVIISSHSPFVICEAWNGEDRDFIHQVKIHEGKSLVRKFTKVIEEQGIMLSREKNQGRIRLSLGNAEEIMSGYLS